MHPAFMILLAIFGIPALIAFGAIIKGWAVSVLWGWFFVPLGLPPIGVALAIGVSLTITYLTMQRTGNEAEKDDEAGKKLARSLGTMFFAPLVTLGAGWIVKQFL